MTLPIQYATTRDGVRIAYASFGTGRPLVFASNIFGDLTGYRFGWPSSVHTIDRLVQLGWRVVCYDVRGMGSSDRNVEDLSLDGRVRDLAAVVSQLGLDHFHLAGFDIGAATAVAYAVQYPTAVSRLVLLTPWPSGPRYLQLPALRAAYAAEATSAHGNQKLFANILASVATDFRDERLARLEAERHVQSTSAAGLAAYNAANERIDLTPLLPRVAMPALVVHFPAFPFGSFQLCQDVVAAIPGAELVIVADHPGFGPHDETLALVDRFLRTGTAGGVAFREAPDGPAPRLSAPHGLTGRERQVLQHVAQGSSNKEIANDLGLAVSTVERHLVNLYTKIGARGRADAIAYAIRHRLDLR